MNSARVPVGEVTVFDVMVHLSRRPFSARPIVRSDTPPP